MAERKVVVKRKRDVLAFRKGGTEGGSSFYELFFFPTNVYRDQISWKIEIIDLAGQEKSSFLIKKELIYIWYCLREDSRSIEFWEKIDRKVEVIFFPSFQTSIIIRYVFNNVFLLHLPSYSLPIIPTAQQKIRATRAIETERGLSRATKLYDLNKRQRKSVKNNPKYSLDSFLLLLFARERGGQERVKRGDRGSCIKRVLCAQVCTSGYALFCQQRRSYQHARYNLPFLYFVHFYPLSSSHVSTRIVIIRSSINFLLCFPTFTLFVLNVINYFTLYLSRLTFLFPFFKTRYFIGSAR